MDGSGDSSTAMSLDVREVQPKVRILAHSKRSAAARLLEPARELLDSRLWQPYRSISALHRDQEADRQYVSIYLSISVSFETQRAHTTIERRIDIPSSDVVMIR